MELVALYKRVIGLDIHQAQITACALIEETDGEDRAGCNAEGVSAILAAPLLAVATEGVFADHATARA